MIALHPTGCKLSSFLLHLLSFALQKKTKKSFQRKKIFGQEGFFFKKNRQFSFSNLGQNMSAREAKYPPVSPKMAPPPQKT
jgi:hypothetical protein